MTSFLIDNRYRFLRPLGKGGMGEVACVFDRLTATEVALKRVRMDADGLTSSGGLSRDRTDLQQRTLVAPTNQQWHSDTMLSPRISVGDKQARDTLRMALAQEFHTLASLRHPHIISVLDYGFDSERRPFFTMEIIKEARPLLDATRGLLLEQKFELLGQLFRALSYLHRRGVLHRDLKPSNVLVAKEEGKDCLKVLDFGLAIGSKDRQKMRAEVAGTLGYLAPEILLGASPSEASDLYAVGIMAYEVLAEQSPFEQVDDERLLDRLLDSNRQPDLAPLAPFGKVREIVEQLIAHAPESRYASASAALAALGEATGLAFRDSAGVRESYLQAAPLTGRDREWSELQGYVDRLTSGSGSGMLIAGESGVGKSRLVEELRTYALVHGARVVNGQGVSGGGSAYHVFQNAIRVLCLSVPLTDAQGSILKALAADLPKLLERPLPEAPPIDAQAAQSRLHNTIESLLGELDFPLVLILEDLQWADSESLALLRRILSAAKTHPLLIAGTFRDDERPHLSDELLGTPVLKLTRLPSQQIAELCHSMLGALPRPELLDFLVKETEGNVFFIVEIMRALAEEVGGLGGVLQRALPLQVLTGGIRAILQRRIEQVPLLARRTLRLMAVAGRQLDLQVLRQFEPLPDAWLGVCAEAAVLEVSEQHWRFAHDKLREALLAELPLDERRRLHREIAAAIERAYSDPTTQATALAYHYREAGMEVKAAHFGILAGEQALGQGALAEAASLLQQVLATIDKLPDLTLLEWARAHRLLAQAFFGLHNARECVRICEKALLRLQPVRWGPGQLRQTLTLFSLVGEHALHQAVPSSVRLTTDSAERALLYEQLLMILAAGEMHAYLGQPLLLVRSILAGNELARALDDVPLQAFTTSVAAFMVEFTPLRSLAPKYLRQAQRLVNRTDNPLAEAQVCRIGGIVYTNNGQVERGTLMQDRASELFRQLGDDFMLLFSLAQAGLGRMLMGLTAEADLVFSDMASVALRGRHPHSYLNKQAWAGLLAARRGQHSAVRKELLEAYEQSEHRTDPLVTIALTTGIITASLRTGDFTDARRCAEETLALLPESPTGYNYFVALAAVLDTYLTLWEASPSGLASKDEAAFLRALAILGPYAAAMLLARAQARLIESRVARLQGKKELALDKAESALMLAMQMRLPYEEALAHEQIGRLASDPEGHSVHNLRASGRSRSATEHLRRAVILFQRFGDHGRAQSIQNYVNHVH